MWKIILICYLTLAPLTYAELLAEFQSSAYGSLNAARDCRTDIGDSALLSLLPPVWIADFFLSGFYEHGLQWTCRQP